MSRNDELYDAVRKGSVEQVENYLSEAGQCADDCKLLSGVIMWRNHVA